MRCTTAETRFAILQRTDPERAGELAELAQADADERWRYYSQLAGIQRSVPHIVHDDATEVLEAAAPVAAAATNGKGAHA